MLNPIHYVYQGKPVRLVILDDGIYFVFRDLCRIPGFRLASDNVNTFPVYQQIKTNFSSATVRLISRDSVFCVLSYMHHMEKYADEEAHLYRWLMRNVLPVLYKRPDCKKFIPHAPWATTRSKPAGDEPKPDNKTNEDMKNLLLTQFAFILLNVILESMPVVFVGGNGKKEKSGNDR